MSMSTGDIRRPTGKQTKAAAADIRKPKDEAEPKDAESTSGTDAKAAGSSSGTGSAKGGSSTRPAAKAGASKASPASAKAAPAKASAASTKAAPAKTTPASAKTTPAKATAKRPAGRPPVKGAGGRGRRPVAPVKVHSERNWGPIALFAGAGVVAVLIIGFAAVQLYRQSNQPSWTEQAAGIDGIVNYRETDPQTAAERNHQAGQVTYKMNPPAAGNHNSRWQNCMGDVYTSQIAKEHAVHSLEHGAVWITYRPDLPQSEIDTLAGKVRDKEFLMLSPYPGQDRPISLQAWGYQLKVDQADDGRIDQFINALRKNATLEAEAGCSGGITEASPTPFDLPSTEG
jgi:hypothetical protein